MVFDPPLQLPLSIDVRLNGVGRIKAITNGEPFEDTSPIFVTISNSGGSKTYVAHNSEWWEDIDTLESIGSILELPAGSDVAFDMYYDLPQRSTGTANYTLTFENERNAHDAKFKLIVNEGDLGYFEI